MNNTVKSIGAVVAGALVAILLSIGSDAVMRAAGFFTGDGQAMANGPFLFATIYRTVYGVAGAYLAALLAPNRPMMHALVLGILGLVASVAGAVAMWNKLPAMGPRWYALALVVLALPPAWLGGKLRVLQLRGRG
jgi:hypothetical protein